jgi:hypothetical protein
MAKARSTVLVIDCSIAHAAGPEDAVHPTAKHCRDFLLAAIQSDQRIAALDDKVLRLFAMAARKHKAIQQICWVNPDREFEDVLKWLEAGTPLEQARKLGNQ